MLYVSADIHLTNLLQWYLGQVEKGKIMEAKSEKGEPPPYTEFAEPPGSTQPSFHQPHNPHQYNSACKILQY